MRKPRVSPEPGAAPQQTPKAAKDAAYARGYLAAMSELSESDSIYAVGTEQREAWDAGYKAGTKVRLEWQ